MIHNNNLTLTLAPIFGAATFYNVGYRPAVITQADFNNDGGNVSILDLLINANYNNSISSLFGIGNGSFLPAIFVAMVVY